MPRKVIVYIACSLDGYIAGPGDDLSFLDAVQVEGEDYGYADFTSRVDTVIMGRKTYDWVMDKVPEFPHADKQSFIITRTPRPSIGNITFYHEDPCGLVRTLRAADGGIIFVDGGAALVQSLLREGEVDELIVSVVPVLLGRGVHLFGNELPMTRMTCLHVRSFASGLVQMHYAMERQ